MLRVKKDSLESIDQKYYFKGELFSGYAYALRNGLIKEVIKLIDGKNIGEYRDAFFNKKEHNFVIDDLELEGEKYEDEEPFLFRNQRFSGVAYGFDGDYCVSAASYAEGYSVKEISWYKTGVMGYYESFEDGIGEHRTWHSNGNRNNIAISENNIFRFSAEFTVSDGLKQLSIFGQYFERLKFIKDKLEYPFIDSTSDIQSCQLSNSIYLSGDGIKDQLFEALINHRDFNNVYELRTFNTSMTIKGFNILKEKKNLKRLIIVDDEHDFLSMMKEYKLNNHNCYVEFNEVEVKI